jgi:hypothetical protein
MNPYLQRGEQALEISCSRNCGRFVDIIPEESDM